MESGIVIPAAPIALGFIGTVDLTSEMTRIALLFLVVPALLKIDVELKLGQVAEEVEENLLRGQAPRLSSSSSGFASRLTTLTTRSALQRRRSL
jgi:hypothetical protein